MKKILLLALLCPALFTLTGCETPAQRQAAFTTADYGPEPQGYEPEIRQYVLQGLRDPDSAQFQFEPAEKARYKLADFGGWHYAWRVKVWVNAKNGYGGYSGAEPYWFWFRDGKIARAVRPWEVPVADWRT